MTFLVCKTLRDRDEIRLCLTDESYRLPWLLQRAWNRQGKPINRGWEVSADELIRIHSDDRESYQTRRLLSDFHPSSNWRIGLIELLHIYAFTWGSSDEGNPSWTPFMIKGRDIFYRDDYENLSESEKRTVLADLPEYDPKGSDFAEFLYFNVNKNGNWVWGRSGMANAAFLHGEALAFFQKALLNVPCERASGAGADEVAM
jgi:hypothetical protein